jgi:hypothetical protein
VPKASSPECPLPPEEERSAASGAGAGLRITYPFDGARFVIDPERPTSLQLLEIRVEPEGAGLDVRIDGTPLAKPRGWPLAVGTHTITATAGTTAAPPVRFTVR